MRRLAPQATLVPLVASRAPAIHAAEAIAEQLRPWPIVHTAVGQILRSIADRGLGTRAAAETASVLIHPGSGSPQKCWPIDRFCELARRLAVAGRAVRFVVGEVERDRWPAAELHRLRAVAEVVEPADYLGLYDLLIRASVFVGNDSGPSHLAGIMGINTFVLFGATEAALWRPLGPRVTVVGGRTAEQMTVDEVVARVIAKRRAASG